MWKYVAAAVALLAILATAPRPETQTITVAAAPVSSQEVWSVKFLNRIGNAAPTYESMAFVVAWMSGENTEAAFNPLATTQTMDPTPANPCFNYLNGKCGVKNYVDEAQGIEASAITIANGHYPNMFYGLQNNDPEMALNDGELGTWGTGLANVEKAYRALVAAPVIAPATDMDVRTKLVQTAMTQIGKPYLLGAAPKQGDDPRDFDCSAFVQWVYWRNGYDISRTTFTQLDEPGLKPIESQDLLPGDLIYQQWPSDQHVLMWAGDVDGDGLGDVVNAGGYRTDVNVISNFFGDGPMVEHIIGFRRVL